MMFWAANARQKPTGNQRRNEDAFVKYDNPRIVSDQSEFHSPIGSDTTRIRPKCKRPSTAVDKLQEDYGTSKVERPCQVSVCGAASENNGQVAEEILNKILPPVVWKEDGKIWQQSVSIAPGNRLDVINLENKLRQRLQARNAQEFGICQIRHDLHRECFNELIRQMTITCAERGLLLVRIRDELENTIEAYRDLYTSESAFGIRYKLESDDKRLAEVDRYGTVLEERDDLIKEQGKLRIKLADLEEKVREQDETDVSKHTYDIEVLERMNLQLKNQLTRAVAPNRQPGRASIFQLRAPII